MREGKSPETGMMTSELTKEDIKKFKQPARVCQVCGDKMRFSKQWGKWERKWSMHRECYMGALSNLDRMAGVQAQRQQEQKEQERKRQEIIQRYGYDPYEKLEEQSKVKQKAQEQYSRKRQSRKQ